MGGVILLSQMFFVFCWLSHLPNVWSCDRPTFGVNVTSGSAVSGSAFIRNAITSWNQLQAGVLKYFFSEGFIQKISNERTLGPKLSFSASIERSSSSSLVMWTISCTWSLLVEPATDRFDSTLCTFFLS